MKEFIKKYWNLYLIKKGYVKTDSFNDYIVNIKVKERERTTEELKKEFFDVQARARQEHFLEIEEKNAEVKHLENIIVDMKVRLKETEKVYLTSVKGIKTNLRISSEIGYQVKKLMETSATVYSAFENIQQQAEDHKRDMIENEKSNRALLKME